MGSFTTTTLAANTEALKLRNCIECPERCGWKMQENEKMLLDPDGDEHDWIFVQGREAEDVITRLENRRTYAGFDVRREGTDSSTTFTIFWDRNEIHLLWGAGCPRDEHWPRAVDQTWILETLRMFNDALNLGIGSINTWIDSP